MQQFDIKMTRAIYAICVICALSLLSGCASAKGRADMRIWNEGITKGGAVLVRYPKDRLQILGSIQTDEAGSRMFSVEAVRWFSNWHDGWTEALILARGKARLKENDAGISAQFIEPVLLEDSQNVTIRYKDTILRGSDARVAFSRRLNRISATVDFLLLMDGACTGEDAHTPTDLQAGVLDKKAFMKQTGQILFPEVFGYSKGMRESPRITENRVRGEGINWDIRYTEKIFPPEFEAIRNSGTLFRDWEETADLFYFIFCMESLNHD